MKRTSNPWRFDAIFYAVSTSLLLATPVETFAFELQEQASFAGLLQPPAVPQLSLDPVTASGLSLGTLSAFSERMSERHGQAAPDLVASQWSQFFPDATRPGAQVPAQLEAPSQQLTIARTCSCVKPTAMCIGRGFSWATTTCKAASTACAGCSATSRRMPLTSAAKAWGVLEHDP